MSAFDVLEHTLDERKESFAVELKQPWATAAAKAEEEQAKKVAPVSWRGDLTPIEQLAQDQETKDGDRRILRAMNFVVPSPNAPMSQLSTTKRGCLDFVFVHNGSLAPREPVVLTVRLPSDNRFAPCDSGAVPMLITKTTLTSVDCSAQPDPILATIQLAAGQPLIAIPPPRQVPCCYNQEDKRAHQRSQQQQPQLPLINLRKFTQPQVLNCTLSGESETSVDGTDPHVAWVQRLASMNAIELESEIERSMLEISGVDGHIKTPYVRVRLPPDRGAVPTNTLQFLVMSDWNRIAKKTMEAIQATADEKQKETLLGEFVKPATKDQPAHVLAVKSALKETVQDALRRAGRNTAVVDARCGLSLVVTNTSASSGRGVFVFAVSVEYALFEHPGQIHLYDEAVALPVALVHTPASAARAGGASSASVSSMTTTAAAAAERDDGSENAVAAVVSVGKLSYGRRAFQSRFASKN